MLELRYEHGCKFCLCEYKLILSFDRMDVCADIKVRVGDPVWSDVASVKGYSLQGALIWAEEVLDKEIESLETQDEEI